MGLRLYISARLTIQETNAMDYTVYLATMNTSTFRAFRKALNVLLRAGVNLQDAVAILCEARNRR